MSESDDVLVPNHASEPPVPAWATDEILPPIVIPPDQMEITLDIAIPDAAAGTLVLADGGRWAATRSEAVEGGTRLIYLVPLAQVAQPAGWELPHGGDLPSLLALNLPAPESRAALRSYWASVMPMHVSRIPIGSSTVSRR